MERHLLPISIKTRDGLPLSFWTHVTTYQDFDMQTWPTVNGIRTPREFEVEEWHDDGLVITYSIAQDSQRGAFHVLNVALARTVTPEFPRGGPVTNADACRARPDYVLQEALAYFERLSPFDRPAVVEPAAMTAPAPRSVATMKRRRATTDDVLRRVAEVYAANVDTRPAEAVQADLQVSRATADRRIREAREAGHLKVTATRGRKPRS